MLVQDRNYNRDNITDTVRINSEETIEQTKEKIKKFRKELYGYAYGCNPDYKKYYFNNTITNHITDYFDVIIFTLK